MDYLIFYKYGYLWNKEVKYNNMYQEGLGGGLENSNGTPLILHSKNVFSL